MTIDEARTWLQHHADNTPMPGAREAYKTILEALERTRWVPVAELPPKKDKFVLCSDGVTVSSGVLSENGWVTTSWNRNVQPVYWMPLPEPPEE